MFIRSGICAILLFSTTLFSQTAIHAGASLQQWDSRLQYRPSIALHAGFQHFHTAAFGWSLSADVGRAQQSVALPNGSELLNVDSWSVEAAFIYTFFRAAHFDVATTTGVGWRQWRREGWNIFLPMVGSYRQQSEGAGGPLVFGGLILAVAISPGMDFYLSPQLRTWHDEQWWLNGRLSGGVRFAFK